MSASNFGDSMECGKGRSSGSRKGKRAGSSSSDKPRQPQRGLGVAQLEKIRMQSEMVEYLHQPPPIHRTAGSLSLEEASNSLPSSPSSSFHANINVSSPYRIHPDLQMAYGGEETSDTANSSRLTPSGMRSPPNYYGTAHYSAHPSSDATLPLFEPEESICLKRHHDLNQSVDSSTSMNLDDPQDVDLELKL